MTPGEARLYLSRLSSHAGRVGDTSNLNPEFAVRLASAIQQARSEGIPVSLMSGYRDDDTTGSAYDAGGNSSHGYGLAGDVGGLDGAGGALTTRWGQIAQQNGLSNP
jgi:Tfp pilus assembly protein FimT